jgi:hypothetical protein
MSAARSRLLFWCAVALIVLALLVLASVPR